MESWLRTIAQFATGRPFHVGVIISVYAREIADKSGVSVKGHLAGLPGRHVDSSVTNENLTKSIMHLLDMFLIF